MQATTIIKTIGPSFILLIFLSALAAPALGDDDKPTVLIGPDAEPMQTGKFEPTWESLSQYQAPQWFRDAKFGIWAHWVAQCQPEQGDWYARKMYIETERQAKFHRENYGHPSKFGFKDVINLWKAENWDPDKLMALYKRAGAQYFIALANHHDNFDNFDSKYQPWNSVNIGPKKDLIAAWAKAARNQGLRFGVSLHASHAWTWYEVAQGSDKTGPFAGVPYDGNLTKADGNGQWWDGLDPQDLYAQNHTPSKTSKTHDLWGWDPNKGCSIPNAAYCEKFYNRTVDLINKYHSDLVYFDDTALPLWPVSDAGLRIAAHFYNSNMLWHGGNLEAVLNAKILDQQQRKCMVWDIERGQSNRIEPFVWQTDTCIGGWHYDQAIFERHRYKTAKTVIQMLSDIVSKNGNLLLSIPVRADGTIDSEELKIVEDIAAWMDVNRQCIFATRPWKIFGEGPAIESAPPLSNQGFNEGKGKPFTAQDVRFTQKDDALYAIVMEQPTQSLKIKSLGKQSKLLDKRIASVQLLGADENIRWSQDDDALTIEPVKEKLSDSAVVFKIQLMWNVFEF